MVREAPMLRKRKFVAHMLEEESDMDSSEASILFDSLLAEQEDVQYDYKNRPLVV